MANWMRQGGADCRQGVLTGRRDVLPQLTTSRTAYAALRRCSSCGAWWKEGQRETHAISENETRQTFPDHSCNQAGDGRA